MSKIFRMRAERSSTPPLDDVNDGVMKEQLQFVIRVLSASLTDHTPTSEQYGREAARVKALQPLRGARNAALTQAFLPGRFLRYVGNVQVWPQETSMPKAKT